MKNKLTKKKKTNYLQRKFINKRVMISKKRDKSKNKIKKEQLKKRKKSH